MTGRAGLFPGVRGAQLVLRLGGRRWWADPWAGPGQGYCGRGDGPAPPRGGGREARAWPRAGRCCSSRRPASSSFVLRPLFQAVLAAPSPLLSCRPRGPAGPRRWLLWSCWCWGLLWVRDGELHGMGGVGRDRGGVKGTGPCAWRLSLGYPLAVHAPSRDTSRVLLEQKERALGGQAVRT